MWPWDACWLRMPGERHAGPPRKSWTPIRSHGCGLGMPVAKKDKVHTCGGPRRRPCLGEGRGRRIFMIGLFCIGYLKQAITSTNVASWNLEPCQEPVTIASRHSHCGRSTGSVKTERSCRGPRPQIEMRMGHINIVARCDKESSAFDSVILEFGKLWVFAAQYHPPPNRGPWIKIRPLVAFICWADAPVPHNRRFVCFFPKASPMLGFSFSHTCREGVIRKWRDGGRRGTVGNGLGRAPLGGNGWKQRLGGRRGNRGK